MRGRLGFAIMLAVVSFVTAVDASVLRVPSEYGTINAAMQSSVPGDTVLVAPGTYSDYETVDWFGVEIASCVFFAPGVTLVSESGPELTMIDMTEWGTAFIDYVVFVRDLAAPVTLQGFTIAGGSDQWRAVQIQNSAGLTVRDCRFLDLLAVTAAAIGGVATPLTVESSYFENCSADERGGAIFQGDEALVVRDSEVRDCRARAGGGVYLDGDPGGPVATALVEDCVFIGNSAETYGGAIRFSASDETLIRSCYFEGNHVGVQGGGTHGGGAVEMGGTLGVVEGCTFVRNLAIGGWTLGGAWQGKGVVRDCTFVGNQAISEFGGPSGLYFESAGGSIENNVFYGSRGGPVAEGLYFFARSCNVFWDNEFGPGYDLDPTDVVADPQFCDPVANDFTVHESSPCLPANSNGCGPIGAWGQGCGVVSVEPRSWGSVKAAYRGEEDR